LTIYLFILDLLLYSASRWGCYDT